MTFKLLYDNWTYRLVFYVVFYVGNIRTQLFYSTVKKTYLIEEIKTHSLLINLLLHFFFEEIIYYYIDIVKSLIQCRFESTSF